MFSHKHHVGHVSRLSVTATFTALAPFEAPLRCSFQLFPILLNCKCWANSQPDTYDSFTTMANNANNHHNAFEVAQIFSKPININQLGGVGALHMSMWAWFKTYQQAIQDMYTQHWIYVLSKGEGVLEKQPASLHNLQSGKTNLPNKPQAKRSKRYFGSQPTVAAVVDSSIPNGTDNGAKSTWAKTDIDNSVPQTLGRRPNFLSCLRPIERFPNDSGIDFHRYGRNHVLLHFIFICERAPATRL